MNLFPTSLDGLSLAETTPFSDARGAFARLFCADDLEQAVGDRTIVQINHSRTSSVGAIRGLHFQRAPHAEMKMVRCLRGRVFDVAVDIRAGSPTFLHWKAEELSAGTARMLIIPEGFAHGFQVLEPDSELLYLHTAFYRPEAEGGLRYDDPRLSVAWPLPAVDVSARDQNHPLLSDDFQGLTV